MGALIGLLLAALLPLHAQAETLSGRWLQACQGTSQREERFEGSTSIFFERTFSGAGCEGLSVEVISRGIYALGSPVEKPQGARAVDYTFGTVSLVPREQAVVEEYNARSVCGFRNWELNAEKDVTGRECDFFGLGSVIQIPDFGDQRYGILRISGNELYLGKLSLEKNSLSPETRPTELESAPFRRQ